MKRSIRLKLIVFLLAATIIPFGLSIISIYVYTKNSVVDRFVENNHDLINKSGSDLTNYFEEMNNIPLSIYLNRPYLTVLENGATEYIDINQSVISQNLLNLYYSRQEIVQMHLYIERGKDDFTVYNAKVSGRGKLPSLKDFPYYRSLKETKQFVKIQSTHKIHSYNELSDFTVKPVNQVVSFHYQLTNVTTDQLLGFLSIDVKLDPIQRIFDRIYDKKREHLYVLDEYGNVFYSSNKDLIGKKLNKSWYSHIKGMINQNGNEYDFEENSKHFKGVYVTNQVKGRDHTWTIIKSIPYSNLLQDANKILIINITIGAISAFFVILLTILVSVKFTNPIRTLIRNMKRIEEGELAVSFDSLGDDEFGQLGQHFTSMVEKINDLYIKEYKLQIENKTNQLKVLQSQINPHFLYNALQSIGTLSLKNDGKKVYKLLMSLSKIMRYSMRNNEEFVQVIDEINQIKDYLALQNERYDGRFEYTLNVEEHLMTTKIPKMILQPLVENYFKHGFEKIQKFGKLQIDIIQHEDCMKIKLIDNGTGVSEGELESIRKSLFVYDETQKESIGLKNIFDRIQYYYGKDGNLFIESKQNENFIVELKIPLNVDKGVIEHESANY